MAVILLGAKVVPTPQNSADREGGKETQISGSTFPSKNTERGDLTGIYAHSFQGLDGLQFGVLNAH
jgi:hypothetical protein